jgi:hypothetical protein
MEYHAIVSTKDKCATIRESTSGVTDLEWHHGCRTYQPSTIPSELKAHLWRTCYDVMDNNQWKDYIISLDDPTLVTNNNFINSKVPFDKWDSIPTIY